MPLFGGVGYASAGFGYVLLGGCSGQVHAVLVLAFWIPGAQHLVWRNGAQCALVVA